ncbi:NAD(P)H-hydrate dehydratase [Botrimarina mediterranea]|uniref:ADP-dependent (S)-NAD(P)H-hydrate dehydratase n=1 Tax=Botrimarina mediterranea TaxID=2528022 RepID=A0A518KDK9_9BACT|nr:NAD(P)H-hydrate dehydratase [Botrimarina mediterranea]QDV75884.1 ATP-dependent (S)-NAD(P)H-hydrate dehydratase [Botrimarina mediterranea]QDV80481.1 ATP-dependent (S)-NAD(P)H-hydrate dehydratase [Planctomycetes bacterium K2D]
MIDVTHDPLPALRDRLATSHKGDYGRALVVGGSLGMAGAPALAGMACLRSGAGLVSVATPRCVQATVASFCAAYMTQPLADDGERLVDKAGQAVAKLLEDADAAAIGPGLGRSDAINSLVGAMWTLPTPMVVDADALNSLALMGSSRAAPAGPRVLTPHAGEFARLSGSPLSDPNHPEERRDRTAELVQSLGGDQTVVLLKGAHTIITDGDRYAVNATGNPGMATGGTGDVLTGVITALLAQGLDAFAAARLAAHVHGLAGDLAAAKLGVIALTATDLLDYLPEAWNQTTKLTQLSADI